MKTNAPALVPFPSKFSSLPGKISLLPATVIIAEEALANEAGYLANILRSSTAFPFPIHTHTEYLTGGLSLKLVEDKKLGNEGYRLVARDHKIEILAAQKAGIFHGIQTLLQLLPSAVYGGVPRAEIDWSVACVEIEDIPRFGWRGAMLDSSRHFQPVAFIKKFIDLLAYHKMNSFHWHLVDDHGWRLEIKKYPKLATVGGWRKETTWGDPRTNAGNDGVPHGGFYTQEEVREIVAYAAARHINVVPEIEMPGHSQAALAAYPEFGCWDGEVEVATIWGILDHNVFNPNEETFQFLQDILTEVMDLFPSKFIHVGGDEVKKEPWLNNPKVRERMNQLGVKDGEELQSYFIKRMDAFLTSKGRRLVGWDEILEGGLAEGAVVMSWRGMEHGIEAAKAGHDVVMAPTTYTYLDYYQGEMQDEPLAIYCGPTNNTTLPLEKAYSFEPLGQGLSESEAKHILGVQGQLWAEYLPTTEQVEYMAYPRLCALAEVGWTPKKVRDYAAFIQDLKIHLKRLNILGVRYRPLD